MQLTNDGKKMPQLSHDSDPPTPASKALEFARLIGRLKTTPRTGWVRCGVPKYESVADHSWRVAALAFLLLKGDNTHESNKIDVSRCIQLAVVHDMAESLIGDITPHDNVLPDEKRRAEDDAMQHITALLVQATNEISGSETEDEKERENESPTNHILMDLFHEYEDRTTYEGKAVKDLDLLDMIIQADEYEKRFDLDLSDFFISTPPSRFFNPTLKAVASEVHRQREARKAQSTSIDDATRANLSLEESAFVEEYSKTSSLSSESIEQILVAFKNWNDQSD